MMPTDQTRPAVPPYGRADAIIDGLLIAVPEVLSRKFGFEYSVAVTQGAWADTVAWPERAELGKPRPTRLTEADRITTLLWAARWALTTHSGDSRDIEFMLHRVPSPARTPGPCAAPWCCTCTPATTRKPSPPSECSTSSRPVTSNPSMRPAPGGPPSHSTTPTAGSARWSPPTPWTTCCPC